jgi:hypothetical protein
MSGPDFHELVGDEGTAEDLALMRRAHDLLVAAGPPPELSPRLAEAPATAGRGISAGWLPRRRRGAAFVLAAGVVAAAFFVGLLVGNRGSSGFQSRQAIRMHAVAPGSAASASILIGGRDSVGNWPMLVRVKGLRQLPKGQYYELYLTRNGKLAAYCGSFAVTSGRTTVRFSIPYSLKGRIGWVVTPSVPRRNPPILLTT